ncbi:MAG: hypothetical protein ACRDJE_18850 [Dehalococcoidia bacterium]
MRVADDDLLRLLEAGLGGDETLLLDAVRAGAEDRGTAVYLVGGAVRDLLIGRMSPDWDVAVEGDAIGLAREVARRLGLERPVVHEAFGTATVTLGGAHVDLITTRQEEYPEPGALPVVRLSTLADDLARRDFTINAMALGLSGAQTGDLVDPYGGVSDLHAGVIRVLHEGSFRDDATRLLRAARYAARFRFSLERETERLAHRNRAFLATISPARVRNEFERAFAEPRPAAVFRLMQRLDLPPALLPELRFGERTLTGLRRLSEAEWRDGALPWLVPVLRWQENRLTRYVERFALMHNEARAVRAIPRVRSALATLARDDAGPSKIVAKLDGLPEPALCAWVRWAPRSRSGMIARRYLDELRHVRPLLTSEDLKRMGVAEGPLFGEVVRALRAARLDDPTLTLDDEVRLVQDMVKQYPGA